MLTESDKHEIKCIYADALAIQEAVNPAGVVTALCGAMRYLNLDLGESGLESTRHSSYHPVTILIVWKLACMTWLAGFGDKTVKRVELARKYARDVAGGKYVIGTPDHRNALKSYFEAFLNV